VVVGHGLQAVEGLGDHDAHPFVVRGILARTFTPLDRALFVTLDGIEAMHEEEEGHDAAPPSMPGAGAPPVMPGAEPPPVMPGAPPMPGAGAAPASGGLAVAEEPRALSAFLVGTKTRFETLQLKREIDRWRDEPLTAVIPGVTLAELWRTLGAIEGGLRLVGGLTVVIGLLGMLVALYSSLEARRREMAVLRAVGARPSAIVPLLVLESGLVTLVGCVAGLVLVTGGFAVAQGAIEARTGVHLPVAWPGATEWVYVGATLAAGLLIGLVPAWRAYRSSLSDGLSPRL
jgi:putative ABC transport system permease protein